MRSRKAFMKSALAKIILLMVALLFMTAFILEARNVLFGEAGPQACRASVLSRMNMREEMLDVVPNNIPLQCETNVVTIPQERLDADASTAEIQEAVMHDMAELMATCWWEFGNGIFYNMFKDRAANNNFCHMCYSFNIDSTLKNYEPIDWGTFHEYLASEHYSPGLLSGGQPSIGTNGVFDFTAQNVEYTGRIAMTTDRLLESNRLYYQHMADATGLLSDADYDELRTAFEVLVANKLDPAIVIVHELPEIAFDSEEQLGTKLMNEWGIGTTYLNNGFVFIIALNNGKVIYASQSSVDIVLQPKTINAILDDTFALEMDKQQPVEAVKELAIGLKKAIEAQDDVAEAIVFQTTYEAYITGGSSSPFIAGGEGWHNPDLYAQGAIVPYGCGANAKGQENPNCGNIIFKQGEQYALAYVSPNWAGALGENLDYNAIMIALHEAYMGEGAICNINEGKR